MLSILRTLNGGTVSEAYIVATDDAGVDVWLVPIPPFDDLTQEVCATDVYAACQSAGLNSACYDLNHYDANGNSLYPDNIPADPNCKGLTVVHIDSHTWFQYHLGGPDCTEANGAKYKCDAWTGLATNLPPPGTTFVDVFGTYDGCGICSVDNNGQWCGQKTQLEGIGYAVCA